MSYSNEESDDFSSAEEKFFHRQLELKVLPAVARRLTYVCRRKDIPPEQIEDRALYSLRELPEAAGLRIVDGFGETEFTRLGNKTALLSSMAKAQRQSASSAELRATDDPQIQALLERSGCRLDITGGQRKYWNPALANSVRPDCEVFVSRIPRNVFEDELIPFFEVYGPVCEFRMMMDATSGNSRGFGFLCFTTEEAANVCVQLCPQRELHGRHLSVNRSRANSRLIVRGVPSFLDKQPIFDEFHKYLDGVKDVSVLPTSEEATHRSVYVDFDDHRLAGMARHKLMSGRVLVFKGNTITCDWANADTRDDDGDLTFPPKLSAGYGSRKRSFEGTASSAKRPNFRMGSGGQPSPGSSNDQLQQALIHTIEQNRRLEEQAVELHRLIKQLQDQVEQLTKENQSLRNASHAYSNHTSSESVYGRHAPVAGSTADQPEQFGSLRSSTPSAHSSTWFTSGDRRTQQYSSQYLNSTHQSHGTPSPSASQTMQAADYSRQYLGQYQTQSTSQQPAYSPQYAPAHSDQPSNYTTHPAQTSPSTYQFQRHPFMRHSSANTS